MMKREVSKDEQFIIAGQNIKERDYWLNLLAGDLVETSFPYDYEKNKGYQNSSAVLDFELDHYLCSRLMEESGGSQYKIHIILVSGIILLLEKYTGNQDIIVSTPIYKPEVEGKFLNTVLPVRIRTNALNTFRNVLNQVGKGIVEACEHQNYPIEVLLDHVNRPLRQGEPSLLDTAVVLQPIQNPSHIRPINPKIIFSFQVTGNSIKGELEYSCCFYKKTTLERIMMHFKRLLAKGLSHLDCQLSSLEILSKEEKKCILEEFNNRPRGYGALSAHGMERTIPELYERQVKKIPGGIAVIGAGYETPGKREIREKHLSGWELNKKSNQLAHLLRTKGVKPNTVVGIAADCSLEMMIGMLAILKAGAAYLPIDPGFPVEQQRYMLTDSGAQILVSAVHQESQAVEVIDMSNPDIYSMSPGFTCNWSPSPVSSLAYINYTSTSWGNSGKPKGVMIEHQDIVNFLRGIHQAIYNQYNGCLNLSLLSPYISGAELTQVFAALLLGHRLYIVPGDITKSGSQLYRFYKTYSIDISNGTPLIVSMLSQCQMDGPLELQLKHFIISGALLSKKAAETFLTFLNGFGKNAPKLNIVYGTLEGCAASTTFEISPGNIKQFDQILIGKPLWDQRIYIMDNRNTLLPPGLPGELWVAGPGVARGYVNQLDLTADTFKEDTFFPGEKMYKTGDLAKWLPDGSIEFLGRADRRVTLEGKRIALEKIEKQLLKHANITGAAVIIRKDENKDNHLCVYFVSEKELKAAELREFLLDKLPDYLIPASIVQLESIPLTPDYKLDTKALLEGMFSIKEQHGPSGDPIEEKLVRIWSEILEIDESGIGTGEDFSRVGGQSLQTIMMAAKIHKEFNINISLPLIFELSTIKRLAQYIKGAMETGFVSIEPAEKKEYYALSPAQKRLYFLQELDIRSTSYNVPQIVQLEGEPDKQGLEKAFKLLIKRHETLRTSFEMVKAHPVQKIHREVAFNLEYCDLSGKARRDEERRIIDGFLKPFDLSQAPLLRLGLIKKDESTYILVVDRHHIISDAASRGIFLKELIQLYEGKKLPDLRLQYRDYSEWRNSESQGKALSSQEDYWLKEFQGEIPVLELATDYPRPQIQSFAGKAFNFSMSSEETVKLKKVAAQTGATIFMILLGIYNIFLSKIAGQEDIVIGSPIAGRRHVDLQHIMGIFINTLAFRNYPNGGKTFIAFLEELKERTLNAFENQDYPFEVLVDRLTIQRDISRNPLFNVLFTLHDPLEEPGELPGRGKGHLEVKPYDHEIQISIFDLYIDALEVDDTLCFTMQYCTKLFKAETIKRFISYFKTIISSVIENPGNKISGIEIIPTGERKKLLFEFNDTGFEFRGDKTIHCLFEETVEQYPGNIALIYGNHQLTYRELNRAANHLAGYLRLRGVGPDHVVGLMVRRSMEMVIGILGIMKAGGAYLPIEPDYPQERIDYILTDSQAKILLTSREITILSSVQAFNNRPKGTSSFAIWNLGFGIFPRQGGQLAYVLYTSGSSGRPKGVLVQHCSVVNILLALFKKYPLLKEDTYLLKTTYTFDVSVSELFGWYLGGGRLAILEPGGEKDPLTILDWIERIGVTHINFVPSMFGVFLEILNPRKVRQLSNLIYIFLAGEALPPHLVTRFNEFHTGIFLENIYGPTEATIYASQFSLLAWEGVGSIPIGKPLSNIRLYILNSNDGLQPIGVSGELCVGGAGLARGYLNRPELTAEKFVEQVTGAGDRCRWENNKKLLRGVQGGGFLEKSPPGRWRQKIYKTGDLARWQEDGNIEFLGRIDRQIKVRGFRIELGEIENRLVSHRKVKEAVVVGKETEGGDKYLCAYIIPAVTFETALLVGQLREYLSQALPDYMIPAYFVTIDNIPRTPSGKVDRKALPEPVVKSLREYVPPRNESEEVLVGIWSEILDIDKETIGIDDNFFELGGHSLKATILTARINKEFDVNLPLVEIFRSPTIREISQFLKRIPKIRFSAIEPAEKKDYYPLAPAQKRLYILQEMDRPGTAYNMTMVIPLEKEFKPGKLKWTFEKLIERHESLRTSFFMAAGFPLQKVFDKVEFEIEYDQSLVNGHGSVENRQGRGEVPSATKVEKIIRDFIRPFNLAQAPLLRVGLVKLPHTPTALGGRPRPGTYNSQQGIEDSYLLMVDMHHILSDAVSNQILVNDFKVLYEGETLTPLRLQYKDFSEWQTSDKETENLKQQEKYWLKKLEGEIPKINLPFDYLRPKVQSFEGDDLDFETSSHETDSLQRIAQAEGATIYMVLLALYNIFLAKLSNQDDIVIGTPVMGRRHVDLEKVMGIFVNTLPLWNHPEGDKTFRGFLRQVKDCTLRAFENQDYQFEDLVDKVVVNRDSSRSPIFDVMFAMQNLGEEINREVEEGERDMIDFTLERKTAKFDLILHCLAPPRKLFFTFEYRTKLFKKETIERFIGYFKKIVSAVVKYPGIKLAQIEIITGEEKGQLLYGFNKTDSPYPKDKTIHRLFEEQTQKAPDRIAVFGPCVSVGAIHESPLHLLHLQITYRELDNISSRMAHWLKQEGVEPDTIVAIMIQRSPEMIIGILGILKAGGGYLPIDPDYPKERIDYMLNDSASEILVTTRDYSKENKSEKKIVHISGSINHALTPPYLHLSPVIHTPVTSLAYIIYTSGTTGRPKGSMIQHGNVVRLLFNDKFQFDFNSSDTWTMFHSYCFDFSVWEMYGALLYGGKLVLIPQMTARNPREFLVIMKKEQVTVLNQTPAAFYHLIHQELKSPGNKLNLKYVIFGGEALKPIKLKQWKEKYPGTKLINMFGITETTVHVTYKAIEDKDIDLDISNIGTPIPTLKTYVMDKYLKLLPIGVAGELCVGGDGLGRGYLNRPGLTVEKFVENPYKPGQKLYKSGDLVRLSGSGAMEYLGRIDQQVKIRGYRIELGEIESQLLTHDKIREVVVIATDVPVKRPSVGEVIGDGNGFKQLWAYIVSDETLTMPGLKESLAKKLPGYMIPSYFVRVEKIPLTANGKVDRKALDSLGTKLGGDVEYAPPETEMEKIIANIWQEVLELDKPGIDDSFFDMGGNSLKVVQLYNRLNEILKKDIPIVALFEYVTIRSFIHYMNREDTHGSDGASNKNIDTIEIELAEGKNKIKESRMMRRARKRGEI
ncbi:MAG: amino acid adenylation domain-containing protein [Candidatus Aminicenantes bacterium]|jgi:amino acid adenylation domain-containing protein